MALIPILPGKGISLVLKNMCELRINDMSGNMVLPQTYRRFYQNVSNKGTGDYKQKSCDLANIGHFNYGATGGAAKIFEEILSLTVGFAQSGAKTSFPVMGRAMAPLVMTSEISFG